MPRKSKPLSISEGVDPKRRFDTILTALLIVKKDELQKVEAKLKDVRNEKQRRERSRSS